MPLYPHSLLYFISGVLEDEPDKPLVGMERYYSGVAPYDAASYGEIATVQSYLSAGEHRLVWSKASHGAGLNSDSEHHGDFDNDAATLRSQQHIIRSGFDPA